MLQGKEGYDALREVLPSIMDEVKDIKANGVRVDDRTVGCNVRFSADWKFLSLCMGLQSASGAECCLYCIAHKVSTRICVAGHTLTFHAGRMVEEWEAAVSKGRNFAFQAASRPKVHCHRV